MSPFQQGREWLASNFLLLYHPGLSQTLRSREERKWSPTKQALIVKQIHLLSTLGNDREQYGEYAYWCMNVKGNKNMHQYRETKY